MNRAEVCPAVQRKTHNSEAVPKLYNLVQSDVTKCGSLFAGWLSTETVVRAAKLSQLKGMTPLPFIHRSVYLYTGLRPTWIVNVYFK